MGLISIVEPRSVDLPPQNNELLAQQSILHKQFRLTATNVQRCPRHSPGHYTDRKKTTSWLPPYPPQHIYNATPECGAYKHHKELKKCDQLECFSLYKNAE